MLAITQHNDRLSGDVLIADDLINPDQAESDTDRAAGVPLVP
jgi:hypothetical protein